jgi:YHS domain-containing protein
MLRILFFGIFVYLLYRVFRKYFGSRGSVERGNDGGAIDEMVQDPSCKTYIPKRTALRKRVGGQELFFCSRECADKYDEETRNRT